MVAQISVIIPTLNAVHKLTPCLAALQEGITAGIIREVIFADGGSCDDISALADLLGAKLVTSPPGRGTQLAAGVAASQGAWVMVLHADSVLDKGWIAPIYAHITHSQKAAYGKLHFDCTGFFPHMVAGWANLRARLFGLPYGDQMLLLSRQLYDRVGGYLDIPLMEDVALARALRGHLQALDVSVQTSADRYLRNGWVTQSSYNLYLLIRYILGADPTHLAHLYRR